MEKKTSTKLVQMVSVLVNDYFAATKGNQRVICQELRGYVRN